MVVLIQLVSCVSSGSLRRQAVELHRLLIQPCVHRFTTLPPMRSERKHILLCPQSPCPHAAGVFFVAYSAFFRYPDPHFIHSSFQHCQKKILLKFFSFPGCCRCCHPFSPFHSQLNRRHSGFGENFSRKKNQFPISRFSSLCSPSWTTRSQEIQNLQRRATAPLWFRSRPTLWHQALPAI